MTDTTNTPRTDAHVVSLRLNPEVSGCNRTIKLAESLEQESNMLLEALVYARRFLKKTDHDTDYVDSAIAAAKKAREQ